VSQEDITPTNYHSFLVVDFYSLFCYQSKDEILKFSFIEFLLHG
jgi:hypothetical protein